MNQSHKISEKLLIPYDIWFYVTFSNSALKKKGLLWFSQMPKGGKTFIVMLHNIYLLNIKLSIYIGQ